MNKWLVLYVAALAAGTAFATVEPGQANTRTVVPASLTITGKIADRLPATASTNEAVPQTGRVVRVVYPSHLSASK
jgi:hypothetical protein